MSTFHSLLLLALLVALVASVFDLRTGHIPNRLTLGALVLGGALQIAALCWVAYAEGASSPLPTLMMATLRTAFGAFACGLPPYLLFLRGGMGGGDVKLMAALGATLGPVIGLEVELYAFLGMALFACGWLAYQGRLSSTLGRSAALLLKPLLPAHQRRAVAPELLASLRFAPAVFAAVLAAGLLHWRSQ